MSGRMDKDLDGRRGPSDYFRGGHPPPHGDYYGGPPPGYAGNGPGFGRDIRDYRNNRGPPFPARFNDSSRGPPPPPPRNRRRMSTNNGVISFRSYEEEREWIEERRRRRLTRPSKFDIMPSAEQLAASQAVSVQGTTDHSIGEKSLENDSFQTEYNVVAPSLTVSQSTDPSALPQQTRHARRLYVGNLPQFITEDQIHRVFRDAIWQALLDPPPGEKYPFDTEEDPILSVYINHERRFCFLEFKSVELCSACMALDGLEVMPGQAPVKVKRPNDYNQSLAPKTSIIPQLDVSRLGIISPTVLDGPNKIFIGGLHYHMTETQVLELLQAFGKVKAFHLVKNEPDASTSKGYAFVEYSDSSLTATVITSLNGMDIGGGKSLTARLAGERHGTVAPVISPTNAALVVPPIIQAQQLQQQAHAAGIGQSSVPPDKMIVSGYDIENLVDAALGKCAMPSGPTYFDSFGQPITRIVQLPAQAIALQVPALTAQQQLAINALPSMNALPVMNSMPQPMVGLPGIGLLNTLLPGSISQLSGLPISTLPPLPSNIPVAPTTTIPALTPQQQAAVNALSLLPVGGIVAPSHLPNQNLSASRILVLLNMVTEEDLQTEEDHAALIEEIKEECTKFGTLKSIKVPRTASLGIQASAVKKVFLEYSSVEDAVKAEAELSGRQFGPNIVETSFFSEIEYAEDRLY